MRRTTFLAVVLLAALLAPLALALAANTVERYVDPVTLKTWLNDPQVMIIDVRQPNDWNGSAVKIKGAVRQDPAKEKVPLWAANLPKNKKIVLYCA